jgi:hypothetical protein
MITPSAPRSEPWRAVVLTVSGILFAIAFVLHPDDGADPAVVAGLRWQLVHLALVAAAALGLLGLAAIRELAPGRLGSAGYLLLFTGMTMFVFVFAFEGFVAPVMWTHGGQALLDQSGPLFGGLLGAFLVVVGGATALGLLALGAAVLRARRAPAWIGVALVIAAASPFVPPLPYAVLIVSGFAVGLALAGAGAALLMPTRFAPRLREGTSPV